MHRCKHILQPRKADPQSKAVVRASTSPTQEKLFLKNLSPSKNFKNANTQSDKRTLGQLVARLNIVKGCKTRTTRTPACNSVYVAIAGEVVYRRSVHLKNIVLNGQVSASNPLLHIHANR